MHPDLIHLHHLEDLDRVLFESHTRPLLLFKHSYSCGVSAEALDELVEHLNADVVAAVPACWIDVRRMADLEEMAASFRRLHGRRVRVATKYMNLTRRFFAARGVTGYRIVESFGATEGAPAAGLAELIVDITTTGSTLRANGLRILDDGLILRSEANLVSSKVAAWSPELRAIEREVLARLAG